MWVSHYGSPQRVGWRGISLVAPVQCINLRGMDTVYSGVASAQESVVGSIRWGSAPRSASTPA